MTESLTEVEKQILRIAQSEERIARLKNRVERLKAGNRPAHAYEALLKTMQEGLALMKERLARLTAPVTYRCYLMTGEHIQGVRILQCIDDAEVVTRAAELLDASPEHSGVEVWQGKRLVERIPGSG